MGKVLKKVVGAVAVGGLALLTQGSSLAFMGLTGLAAAGAIAGTTLALGVISKALGPKMNAASGAELRSPIRSATPPKLLPYGNVLLSGVNVFGQGYGSDNEFLSLVFAVSNREIEGFVKFYHGPTELTLSGNDVTGTLNGFLKIFRYTGSAGQTADSTLVANTGGKWTADHTGDGIGYYHVQYKFDQDKFPNGAETISAEIEGALIYDPRLDTTQTGGSGSHREDDPTTWEYSRNPVLIWYDFMTKAEIGPQLPAAAFDIANVMAEANICDEAVSLAAGGTQDRYTCDAVFSSEQSYEEIEQVILSTMAGQRFETGGLFRIKTGAWDTPTITITDDDVIGPIQVQWKRRRQDRANAIKGLHYSTDITNPDPEIPPRINSTWQTADGGRLWTDIRLPATQNSFRAQRIAQIQVRRLRADITVQMPVNLKGLALRAGDTVQVTRDYYGWSSKTFRVQSWSMDTNGVIGLGLTEETSSDYAWSTGDELTPSSADAVSVYDPATAYAVSDLAVTAVNVTGVGSVVTPGLEVTWTPTSNPFIREMEIQWKKSAASSWVPVKGEDPSEGELILSGLMPGEDYDVRARYISTTDVRGAWSAISDTTTNSDLTSTGADWGGITGTGKPADNATVGAPAGTNVGSTAATTVEGGANAANAGLESDGTVKAGKVVEASIATSAVTNAKLAALAVDAAKLAAGAVTEAKIANAAVTANKIQDAAIVTAKLAAAAVDNAKLANLAVDAAKLADSAVTSTKIANAAVGSAAIANLAVGSAKIADAAIVEAKIGTAAVTNAKIANGTIQSAKIGDAQITSAKIANAAVGNAAIANLAVTNAKIADGTIQSAKIGDLQVSTVKIADNAVTLPVAVAEGSTINSGTLSNWADVTEVTLPQTFGQTIDALMTCNVHHASASGGIRFRILEDGVVKHERPPSAVGIGANFFFTGIQAAFAAKTGTNVVYKVQSTWTNGSAAGLYGVVFRVQEIRK